MIIGIDHIALSATDIDRATDIVSRWGYKPIFINKKLANNPIKGPYLHTKNLFHDIAYCEPISEGIPIELTAHDSKYAGTEEDGTYKVIFSGMNPGCDCRQVSERDSYNCGVIAETFGSSAKVVFLKEFSAAGYHIYEKAKEKDKHVSIKAILSESLNLDDSAEFWFNFGFSLKKIDRAKEENWRLLEFKNHFFRQGFNLLIVRAQHKVSRDIYKLDNAGVSCLAFLTSNISAERERLKKNGTEVTGTFSLEVGGRLLRICLCRGNTGELLELIEIDTKGKTNEK